MTPKLAIISPCYNEEELIKSSGQKLLAVLNDLIGKQKIQPDSFIYFVDDGSVDNTWPLIFEMHNQDPHVKGVKFSRHFGYQKAHLAGLLNTRERADCFVSIDSDLQDDVLKIEEFIDAYQEGYEIVFGAKANSRRDSQYKKYGNKFFYFLMRLMGVDIITNHAEFRLVSQKALAALADYKEVNLFLRGLFRDLGFKTKTITYDIKERAAGKSKFTFKKLLSLALDGITSFSIVPLRLSVFGGVTLLSVSLVLAVLILFKVITGTYFSWLLTVLFFVTGLQLTALGVVAEYVGKIYIEAKGRPRFIKDIELW